MGDLSVYMATAFIAGVSLGLIRAVLSEIAR